MKNKSYPLAQSHVVEWTLIEKTKRFLFGTKLKKYQVKFNFFIGYRCVEQRICVEAECKSDAVFIALNELKKRIRVEGYKAVKHDGFGKKWDVTVKLHVGSDTLAYNYCVTAFNKGEAFVKGEHHLKSDIRIVVSQVVQNDNLTLISEKAV